MFKPVPFANALALATAVIYFAFYILQIVAPPFFKLLINSQFFGADFASQVPAPNIVNFLGILIAVVAPAWVFGYFLARTYNRLSR
ncbi:MAG: DUF5676 family membrane protein [Candidatus Curtissbacteria bacterium]